MRACYLNFDMTATIAEKKKLAIFMERYRSDRNDHTVMESNFQL